MKTNPLPIQPKRTRRAATDPSETEIGRIKRAPGLLSEATRGQGPAGAPIRSGQPCIVRSSATDERMSPWRDTLLSRGFASLASFPLRFDEITAVLLIYSATENAFGEEECRLLQNLSADIGYSVSALRATESRDTTEAALRRSEAILDRAQQIANIGSWEWAPLT